VAKRRRWVAARREGLQVQVATGPEQWVRRQQRQRQQAPRIVAGRSSTA